MCTLCNSINALWSSRRGFVLATGALHVAGITVGMLRERRGGEAALRAGGGAIAVAGCYFLSVAVQGV